MRETRDDFDVAIILPTYSEAENIENMINAIENLMDDALILIVDDSSPDGTANLVQGMQKDYTNIMLLVRPFKMGLGTAIRDGFRFLLSLPSPLSYVVTMDSDFSHNPSDIPKVLSMARQGYDIVIGSRYCRGGGIKGWGLYRRLVSRTANRLAARLIGLPISDFTSGFRCYSTEYIRKTLPKLHSQTYEIEIETLRQAYLQEVRVGEVPIVFENRKKGKSKLTRVEIATFLKYILKII